MFRNTRLSICIMFCGVIIGGLSPLDVLAQETNSQNRPENNFWDSVRFGGSLGLNFGNRSFTGIVAPSAVYEFNNYVSSGVGLNAAYAKQNEFKTTSLGGSILTLINPVNFIQLSAEFQELNIHRKYEFSDSKFEERFWVPALWAGIGYNTGNVVAGIRYDLLHDPDRSFYSSALMPFVSVYF